MAKLLVLILIVILSTFQVHAQTEFNTEYYDSLLVELKANPNVADVKQYSKSYKNGVQKLIYTVAKFENDSIDRYWHTGLCQKYYKNGQLGFSAKYDSLGYFAGGKNTLYSKNGKVRYEIIFSDTKSISHVQKYKNGYFYSPTNAHVNLFNSDGRIIIETDMTYDTKTKRQKLNGIRKRYYYSKKTTKVVEREYKMGKRISKRKYELKSN